MFIYQFISKILLSAFLQLSQRKCTSQKSHLEGRSMFIYKYKAKAMSTIGFSATFTAKMHFSKITLRRP